MNRRGQDRIGPLGSSGVVANWGGSSFVRSVQSGLITLGNSVASATATITAVDTNVSIALWNGGYGNQNTGNPTSSTFAIVTLTNGTTVTAARGSTSGANTLYVPYQVIEFAPGVLRSLQVGTVVMGNGQYTNTGTITSVNTNRSIVLYRGWSTDDTTTGTTPWDFQIWGVRQSLTDATTVTVNRYLSSTYNVTVAHNVVEFF